jgi:DNA polymerase III subunit epsilon
VKPRRRLTGPQEPPSDSAWDLPIEQAPLAFVDIEATGLDMDNDRVVEICIELTSGGQQVARLDTLIHPGARAGGAEHVHGLSAAMLEGAPRFESVANEVRDLLSDAVYVAHASVWDAMFIESEMARAGVAFAIPFHLDTLVLARRAFGLRSNRLGALAEALGLERKRAHRAGDDVAVLRALFERIAAELKPVTPRDLWQVRVGERMARPAVVQACVDAVGAGPVLVHYRPSGRAAEHFPFVVTAVRTDLDPPRVIGYLVPGRGHRDLRSDRILAVEPSRDSIDGLAPGNT